MVGGNGNVNHKYMQKKTITVDYRNTEKYPMNSYAVCDLNSHSVIYIGTRESCERFRRERECEDHTEVWHVHEMEIQNSQLNYL